MNGMRTTHNYEYEYVSLYPGELHIAETPTVIWTVLGSCLAIIFYHAPSCLGAIAHAQLGKPAYFGREQCSDACPNPCYADVSKDNPFKYVSCSIHYMISYFTKQEIPLHEIEIKLFGGSNILGASTLKTVGENNIETACEMLERYQLLVATQHVGGKKGRTLYFYSDTGDVFLKNHAARIDLRDSIVSIYREENLALLQKS